MDFDRQKFINKNAVDNIYRQKMKSLNNYRQLYSSIITFFFCIYQ